MFAWLQENSHYDYVATKFENDLEVPEDFLKTDVYLTCDDLDFKSDFI